jgi:hypothetical protein
MKRNTVGVRESGQAAVLIALSLFTMVVFLALATNMGIVVNDRIRMQNTADLAAYAGAFEQARSLNRLVHINKRLYATAYNVRAVLTCPGPPSERDKGELIDKIMAAEPLTCDPRDGIFDISTRMFPRLECKLQDTLPYKLLDLADVQMSAMRAAFRLENFRAKETAIRAARFTAEANFQGTARPAKSSFFEWQLRSPTFRGTPLVSVDQEGDVQKTTFTWASFKLPGKCGCRSFPPEICIDDHKRDLETWFTKLDPGPTIYFPARVNGVPAKEFVDIKTPRGGYFGADAERGPTGNDELWAFAVAKPFGGSLGAEDHQGEKRHLSWSILFWSHSTNGYDYTSFGEDPEDNKIHDSFIEKYRARMAGIQDNMVSSQGATPIQLMMLDLMRASRAAPPAIDRFLAH